MTGHISTGEAERLATRHLAAFNAAVAGCDYSEFLLLFDDDAVVRFENVPGAGTLEFAGREAYTRAYREQPPDDELDITGTVVADGESVLVPFRWRRDGSPGTMRLTYGSGDTDARGERQVSAMTVVFD